MDGANQNQPADELKAARKAAGYDSAVAFARTHNINTTTYAHHENGQRNISPEVARVYCRILNVRIDKLLSGKQLHLALTVPIVGRIGRSGIVKPMTQEEMNRSQIVPFPDPEGMVAHEVIGNENVPVYRSGDIVIHQRLIPGRYNLAHLHGVECIVELADGQTLLREISYQSNGLVTLLSHAGPHMLDQDVVAAAPIEFVQRRLPHIISNK